MTNNNSAVFTILAVLAAISAVPNAAGASSTALRGMDLQQQLLGITELSVVNPYYTTTKSYQLEKAGDVLIGQLAIAGSILSTNFIGRVTVDDRDIVNEDNPPAYSVSLHYTENEAKDGTNPIASTSGNAPIVTLEEVLCLAANTQFVWFRVQMTSSTTQRDLIVGAAFTANHGPAPSPSPLPPPPALKKLLRANAVTIAVMKGYLQTGPEPITVGLKKNVFLVINNQPAFMPNGQAAFLQTTTVARTTSSFVSSTLCRAIGDVDKALALNCLRGDGPYANDTGGNRYPTDGAFVTGVSNAYLAASSTDTFILVLAGEGLTSINDDSNFLDVTASFVAAGPV